MKIATYALILLICLFILVSILSFFFHKSSPPIQTAVPSPTPIQTQPQISSSNVTFNKQQTEKMIHTLENRPQLSPVDANIKSSLVSSVNNDSGTIENVTNEYRIDYIKSPDMFQVEITTTDLAKAKADAVAWLESQGMTFQGICKLPLTFYLNIDVKQQLMQNGTPIDFNPLPDGC